MINLITSENRATIESVHKKQRLLIYLISLVVVLLSAIVLLVPSIKLLNIRLSTVNHGLSSARARPISKDADNLVATVRELNQKIQKLVTAPAVTPFTELIGNILGHKISGISVIHVDVNQSGGVTMKGEASTRAVLLEFIKSLEADPYYTEVKSPISNLILSNDIAFTVNMNLASYGTR